MIHADYCGGKPRIAGTRMPVATIAQLYLEMGETVEEIDRHTAESRAWVEEMRQNTPPIFFTRKIESHSRRIIESKFIYSKMPII